MLIFSSRRDNFLVDQQLVQKVNHETAASYISQVIAYENICQFQIISILLNFIVVMTETLADTMEALDLTKKPTVEGEEDDFVDPWNVVGSSVKGIDYEKLISNRENNIYPKPKF